MREFLKQKCQVLPLSKPRKRRCRNDEDMEGRAGCGEAAGAASFLRPGPATGAPWPDAVVSRPLAGWRIRSRGSVAVTPSVLPRQISGTRDGTNSDGNEPTRT